MKTKIITLLALAILLVSCGPTISGKDENSFKTSKAKMEEKLDDAEKQKLEIALRVILVKAMKEKFNLPDDPKYKGKSFDDISLAMIDGKTFSGIVDYAEDFLKKDRDDNIKKNELEIDSLIAKKAELEVQNKEIDNFKLTEISISEDSFFDDKQPYLDLTFVNKLNAEVFKYMIQIDVHSKKTGKLVASQQQGNGFSEGDNFKDGEGIAANDTYDYHQPLLSEAVSHSNLWKTAKYPIKDFSAHDLVITAFPVSITTKTKKLVRATNLKSLDKQIAQLKKEITGLKETKGTLDELELTK
ncbi:MAG: hypothetical protein EOO87_02415 [Pedobacter sp.]|nr:MAG: hypothetical protein EOO87_02415 [Pedobacter sp.]